MVEPVRRTLRLLVLSLGGAALVASLLAQFAARHWAADLFVHFRVQYAAVGLAVLLAAAALRSAWPAALGLVLLALNSTGVAMVAGAMGSEAVRGLAGIDAVAHEREVATAPAIGARGGGASARAPDAASRAGSTTLSVAAVNVLFFNSEYDRVLEWVARAMPDVIVFVEATHAWQAELSALRESHPFVAQPEGALRRGLVVYSTRPLVSVRPVITADGRPIALTMQVSPAPGEDFTLVAAHATWPLGARNSERRRLDLTALASAVTQASAGHVMIVGDLNVSPFSPHFARLLADGKLRSATAGRWLPTWPVQLLPAGIQIDHILVSHGVQVLGVRRGPAIGSDHLPLVARVRLPPAA